MRYGKRFLQAIGLGRWFGSHRERLAFQYIRGDGIEIGAQAAPLAVPPSASVRYVDNVTKPEAVAASPELDAERVVAADLVCDGFTLDLIPDGTQDFVIANHVLEHAPDPLGVLLNWLRVLRPGGVLYAAVPLADRCFDNGRKITVLDHLIDDHRLAVEDPDALARKNEEHYREWLTISEPNILVERGTPRSPISDEELLRRAAELASDRTDVHFHTFTAASYEALLDYALGQISGDLVKVSVSSELPEVIGVAQRTSAL